MDFPRNQSEWSFPWWTGTLVDHEFGHGPDKRNKADIRLAEWKEKSDGSRYLSLL